MKRLLLRTLVLVSLIGAGLVAVTQAQRGLDSSKMAKAAGDVEAPNVLAPTGNVTENALPAYRANPLRSATDLPPTNTKPSQSSGPALDPFAQAPAMATRTAAEVPNADVKMAEPMLIEPAPARPATRPAPAAEPPAITATGNNEIPDATAVGDRYATRPAPATAGNRYRDALPEERPAAPSTRTLPANDARAPQPLANAGQSLADKPLRDKASEPKPLDVDPGALPTRMSNAPAEPAKRPAAAPSTSVAASTDGNGQPGRKQLEGPQAPQVVIQKFAPPAVQVGKPALYRIAVKNIGPVPAHGVEIRDQIPRGAQLLETQPRASRSTDGDLVWDLGTLKPGDEIAVEEQLMPIAEGEIGSVATVRIAADATARSVATKPELVVKCSVPPKVLIGEEVIMNIAVSNPGSGIATGVVLSEKVPPGLQHPAGAELEYEIGELKPGETRQIQLAMLAVRAGVVANVIKAHGEGNLRTEDRADLHVIAPQLDVNLEGPKRRFLEREATYQLFVSNPGTAPARQVELVAHLPRGLKFVSANNAGQYEPATQTVHWLLEELPANDSDKVELVTLPIEAGEQKIRLMGKADKGLAAEREQPVLIEGVAAIKFEVVDVNDPIEKGGETIYDIHVVNQGSKAATNVRIAAVLPAGMKAIMAEGPTRHTMEPSRVQFEGLARLAPKADTHYKIRVKGLQPGDLRMRVQLMTDELQEPVTKEESTRVYADE